MSAFSDFSEDTIINVWLRVQATYKPAGIWIGLWTATLDDASTGSTASEVSGGGYGREQVVQADANWDATVGGDGHTQNTLPITFTTATAAWGTVTDVMIVDASSTGNSIFYGALTSPKVVDTDDTFEFAIGDLDITIA
jgi:hypothetical protein